jgi:predicted phage terminase large subunit-like protein
MAITAKDRSFNRELEALRALIQSKARPFPDDKKSQRERVRRGSKDMEYFGQTYFPHYLECPSSALHKYFCQRDPQMIFHAIETGEGDREADAAPRGNAKSTWTTLILPIWCMAYKYRSFILPVSETALQAQDFLSFIEAELETNERLKQDFPDLCSEGPVWRADTIITRNGCKVRGAGAGQKLRGMRHGSKRPDLVIGDDLENDEAVESPDQRKKLEKWFFKALMKIGQPDTVYVVRGTVLHYDSLLMQLLKKPGWKGKKFQAVIKCSEAKKLWEKWEQIFADISVGKEEAEAAADAFFKQHEKEMLAGTEVLWPERESYYYLMKMYVSEGPAYFYSEKQNEPINPEDAVFLEEWIQYYDDEEVDLTGIPQGGACDPSMGKRSKGTDPSAIIGGRMKDNIIWLTVADIEKRHPDKITDDILTYHQRDPFAEFVIEEIQFQELFKDNFEKEAHKRGLTINVKGDKPNTDKDLRIVTLQPWIKNGWIRFKRYGMGELIKQLIYYRPKGKGGHDDGPDGLEMLKRLLEQGMIKAMSVSSDTTGDDYHAEKPGRERMKLFGRRAYDRYGREAA